jgi:hypothetical protein
VGLGIYAYTPRTQDTQGHRERHTHVYIYEYEYVCVSIHSFIHSLPHLAAEVALLDAVHVGHVHRALRACVIRVIDIYTYYICVCIFVDDWGGLWVIKECEWKGGEVNERMGVGG